MAILTKFVIERWNSKNKEYYVSLGYEYTKMGLLFDVAIKDLKSTNRKKVNCVCKICNKEFSAAYNCVADNKDVCQLCKSKQTCLKKYGFENPALNPEVKAKRIATTIERYGVESPLASKEIQEKVKATMVEKYGVEYPLQNKEILAKEMATNQERYGCNFIMENKEMLKKSKDTLEKNFGVRNPMQSKVIRDKTVKTMLSYDGVCCTSKNQNHLCNLLNGKLNYNFLDLRLDVALESEHIDVEYNGYGHKMKVLVGEMSEDDFNAYESKRDKKVLNAGWNIIKFISEKNKLLDDFEIISIVNFSKQLFINMNINFVVVNIDSRKISFGDNVADINSVTGDKND